MKAVVTYRLLLLLAGWLLLIASPVKADDDTILNRTIHLPKSKQTVYQLLGEVSKQTGFLFIYDSKLIDNERVVKLKARTRTVRQAIFEIIGDNRLHLRVMGNHILIYQQTEINTQSRPNRHPTTDSLSSSFIIEGILTDKSTQEPIVYATVGIVGSSIGSVSNQEGRFRLHLPDSLRHRQIGFSHIGYMPNNMEASLLIGQNNMIALEPRVIPIQEVIIRVVNPVKLLREVLAAKETNYPQQGAYLTSFYREGIERKSHFINLTEAVFKVYKTPYRNNQQTTDQVKLLKMRSISSTQKQDTLLAKMSSGIDACLQLDLIKSLPDFLTPDTNGDIYVYVSSDLTSVDDRLANVIYFEQRDGIADPLYKGELYIDTENKALLRAQFELHPKYVKKAARMFIQRKSRHLRIVPQKVIYTLSYKPWNGNYYIHHVRGDLHFKIRMKRKLFSTYSPLHTWFEMVTCKIDTEDVNRFTRREKQPTRTIFSDTDFKYDADFWEDFNVIPPEEELTKSIGEISSKIEETGVLSTSPTTSD